MTDKKFLDAPLAGVSDMTNQELADLLRASIEIVRGYAFELKSRGVSIGLSRREKPNMDRYLSARSRYDRDLDDLNRLFYDPFDVIDLHIIEKIQSELNRSL